MFKVKCGYCSEVFARVENFTLELVGNGELVHHPLSLITSELSRYGIAYMCGCKRSGIIQNMPMNCTFVPEDES